MIDPIGIAANGLSAFTTLTDVTADNIANMDDTAPVTAGGGVGVVVTQDQNGAIVYDPTDPMADVLGYVRMTNLDAAQQMGNLIIGQLGVQLNAVTIDRAVDAFNSVLHMGAPPDPDSDGENSFTG